jgi:hypothetical protein
MQLLAVPRAFRSLQGGRITGLTFGPCGDLLVSVRKVRVRCFVHGTTARFRAGGKRPSDAQEPAGLFTADPGTRE